MCAGAASGLCAIIYLWPVSEYDTEIKAHPYVNSKQDHTKVHTSDTRARWVKSAYIKSKIQSMFLNLFP